MKKIIGLLSSFVLVLSVFGFAGAGTIEVNPNPYGALLGESFDLDIVGLDFTESTGGSLNIVWDSSILTLNSTIIDPGDVWDAEAAGDSTSTAGTISSMSVASFFGINSPFDIATLNFTAISEGSSAIDLTLNTVGGVIWEAGTTAVDGVVNVSAVPIPGAFLLLGSGLLGLVGLRKKLR